MGSGSVVIDCHVGCIIVVRSTPSVFELRRKRDPVDISPLEKGEKPVEREFERHKADVSSRFIT